MNQSNIKYFIIPLVIFAIIIVVVLLVPRTKKESAPLDDITPTLRQFPTPTPYSLSPQDSNVPSPTLIPLQFTGADLSQDIPATVKLESDQKTVLRRLTPLTLPFGMIDFNYENDNFTLTLIEPKDQNLQQFTSWREQNYPSLTEAQFTIN